MGIPVYQLEVRLPSEDGQVQTQVIRLSKDNIGSNVFMGAKKEFPETGESEVLYIATDELRLYVWYGGTYIVISGGSSIDVIDGGLIE